MSYGYEKWTATAYEYRAKPEAVGAADSEPAGSGAKAGGAGDGAGAISADGENVCPQ